MQEYSSYLIYQPAVKEGWIRIAVEGVSPTHQSSQKHVQMPKAVAFNKKRREMRGQNRSSEDETGYDRGG